MPLWAELQRGEVVPQFRLLGDVPQRVMRGISPARSIVKGQSKDLQGGHALQKDGQLVILIDKKKMVKTLIRSYRRSTLRFLIKLAL